MSDRATEGGRATILIPPQPSTNMDFGAAKSDEILYPFDLSETRRQLSMRAELSRLVVKNEADRCRGAEQATFVRYRR
jgi:hypothetical protein